MSGLVRSRAWSVLALLAGITSIWAGDVRWLRLACAAALAIGIAQQLAQLALSIRMRMLGTFWVRLSAATMLCAGVGCWYLANSPRLPYLVVASSLVVLAGQWWLGAALKDADVVQLETRKSSKLPSRAGLYVYNGGNDEFLKVRRMIHVWLHHGDSDKEACHRRK